MSSKAGIVERAGTVAMARTSRPELARPSQFFINVADNKRAQLPRAGSSRLGYTVFGKVVDGMDVVTKIAKVAEGRDRPVPPVRRQSRRRAGRAPS